MEIPRQRKPSIRMEMTPLIDCVFLLLIFFMLSSTFLAPKIRLELPKATLRPDSSPSDPVLVSIDAGGDVYLNNDRIFWEELGPSLRRLLAGADRPAVTVRCDEAAPHRHFVRALDAAKSAGATHVNVSYQQLAVEPPPGQG